MKHLVTAFYTFVPFVKEGKKKEETAKMNTLGQDIGSAWFPARA